MKQSVCAAGHHFRPTESADRGSRERARNYDENEDAARRCAVLRPASFRGKQRHRNAGADYSADPADWPPAMGAAHGWSHGFEDTYRIPDRELRLKNRSMRKGITFVISAALIACALVMWSICSVLGTDAHAYGARTGSFSFGVSSNPYLPIRDIEPVY